MQAGALRFHTNTFDGEHCLKVFRRREAFWKGNTEHHLKLKAQLPAISALPNSQHLLVLYLFNTSNRPSKCSPWNTSYIVALDVVRRI